jgi:hypothetical protein
MGSAKKVCTLDEQGRCFGVELVGFGLLSVNEPAEDFLLSCLLALGAITRLFAGLFCTFLNFILLQLVAARKLPPCGPGTLMWPTYPVLVSTARCDRCA